ncbi:MAG: signal peptidase II [Myxococcales bacterium]|nr:signal peptidase II [Myxococcales bacterium]
MPEHNTTTSQSTDAVLRAAAARWRWPVLLMALALVGVDQWTKYAAIEHLASSVHPMVVAADGQRTVGQLFSSRGVSDGPLAAAIGQRWVWQYDKDTELKADMSLAGIDAPRQLIALAGTGFPAPRRLRVTAADAKRSLGDVIAERWRVAPADTGALLAGGVYRAKDVISSASAVPPAGTQIALLSREINVISGFMKLVYAENPGAAWGVMREMSAGFRVAFFSLISLLASLGMIWAIWTGWMGSTLGSWALGGVLSGAIGNLIDRNMHTIVVDFILNFVGEHRWPVYNVADIGISVGVILILGELLLRREPAGTTT